jgi:Kelch motif
VPLDVYHYGLVQHLSGLQLLRRLELVEIKKKVKFMNKLAIFALLCALSACSTQMQSKLWIPDWKETAPLSIPRAGAAAIAVDDTLYLIGGVDGKDFLNTTEYARIQKDGSLGPWQAGPNLNEPRGFIDAVVHNGSIYVVGGGNGPNGHNLLKTAERARILPDGTLGPWETEKNEMLVRRRCSKLIATDTTLYTFGGFGGVLLDSVEHADFSPDGSLGEWQLEDKTMLLPRYVDGVKKWGSSAYVIGGHDQDKGVGITNVEWSPLGSEEKRNWKMTSPLNVGRYGLATVSHGDYLYALGGLTGLEFLDSVEKSKVNADGQLSSWETTTPLSVPRGMFSVVEYKDWIYVIGGSNRDSYLSSVEYATVNSTADFGYWGNEKDVQAYKAKLARKENQASLPNHGTVRAVLQATAYTYLEVVNDKQEMIWLAGTKLDIKPGDKVGYSKGVIMSGFYSKELDRTFREILFVGQVQQEQ